MVLIMISLITFPSHVSSGCTDTSDPTNFGNGAKVSTRHFGTSAEMSWTLQHH